jgi:HAD superfamily hydrolase (TIGR01484 family)
MTSNDQLARRISALRCNSIVVDIDGTLTDDPNLIRSDTIALLYRALESGIRVCVTTGRSVESVMHLLKRSSYDLSFGEELVLVCENGTYYALSRSSNSITAMIASVLTNRHLESLCLASNTIRTAFRTSFPVLSSLTDGTPEIRFKLFGFTVEVPKHADDREKRLISREIASFLSASELPLVATLGNSVLDVTATGSDKVNTLSLIREIMPESPRTIAIGDTVPGGDEKILSEADLGIYVGRAKTHLPEVFNTNEFIGKSGELATKHVIKIILADNE